MEAVKENPSYKLTYIYTTRNKLPFVQVTLPDLIDSLQKDEELIVMDGASTDGTLKYLNDLYEKGEITQLHSEKDFCQAHATNKAMLLAKGELIKFINDDDVYDYSQIRKCREYMLANPNVDMICGNIADYATEAIRVRSEIQDAFMEWVKDGPPFWFGDQGLMIRRSQIPIIGLWHTGVICIDVEKSLRLTSARQVKLGWHTGVIAVSVPNASSNGMRFRERVEKDVNRLFEFYVFPKIDLKKIVRQAKVYVKYELLKHPWPPKTRQTASEEIQKSYEASYVECKGWLHETNKMPARFM